MRAVALSPHLDDAAFSAGGTIARLTRLGWAVTVCTVFTRSVAAPTGFALACQLDKGLPPDADYMAIRRAEDAAACAALGAVPLWLDYPEAPHRGYDSAAALFGPPLEADAVAGPLAAAVDAVLRPRPDLVLAPQAVGGHVDHVQVVTALRAALPPAVPVLWWTDFPYATRPHSHPARPFAAAMAGLRPLAFTGDPAARQAACTAYASQIGFQFGGSAGLAQALAGLGEVECFRAAEAALPAIGAMLPGVTMPADRSQGMTA